MNPPSLSEVAVALWAAGRLLRLDPLAWRTFDDSVETFWKSFWAALPVLPFYAVMVALQLSSGAADGGPLTAGWLELLLIQGLAYVISWTAYPVVLFHLLSAMGKRQRFVPLIAALNWLTVPLAVIGTLAVLAADLELFGQLSGLLLFGVQIYVLVCLSLLVRRVLEVGAFAAFSIVLLGLLVDYFLLSATRSALI